MNAYSLPSHLVDATVTAVDELNLNIRVWIRLEGDTDDDQLIEVRFNRDGEHLDPAVLDVAEQLEPGDTIEVGYTSIGQGAATINLGRSVTKLDERSCRI